MTRLVALLATLLASCAIPPNTGTAGPRGAEQGRGQDHLIPLTQADGSTVNLVGRTCRPATDARAPVVVIAHGSPPNAADRPGTQLPRCDSEPVSWFTARGYLVVLSLRRGYGGTGGAWMEGYGNCTIDGYEQAARETARDIAAAVAYGQSLPFARPDRAVVVGQSAGGWGALGLNSLPHPAVTAIVSMAGGRGGHMGNVPNSNCHPENLAAAAGRLARNATTPMLWVYTPNDSFFAPPIAQAIHQAYTAAGGRAELTQPGPFGRDGHGLFNGRGGSLVWGPPMERYLQERGL